MKRQLFDNTIRYDPKNEKHKDKLFLLLSFLMHLAILLWLLIRPPGLPTVSKPLIISSRPESLVFVISSLPPPSRALKPKAKSSDKPAVKEPEPIPVPVEPIPETTPELPEEPEKAPTENPDQIQNENSVKGQPNEIPEDIWVDVSGTAPSGVGNNPSAAPPSQGLIPGGNVKPPKKKKHVDPIYPRQALRARIQGTVVIEAIIGIDGKIKSAKAIRSHPMFDQAALDAIKKWEYEPATINGMPIEQTLTVTVNFVLR